MKRWICFILASTLHAASYYVAVNGNDSNPGTSAAPFATVQRGVNAAKPGDTVIVRDGVYGPNGAGNTAFPVTINQAGITLKSENKLGAILDCQNTCYGYISLGANSANAVIDGFEITRGYMAGIHMNSGGAQNMTIRNCHIHHIGNRNASEDYGIVGIYTDTAATGVIETSEIDHIGRSNDKGNSYDQGIYYHGNLTIRGNVFHDSLSGWHIQTADGFSGSITGNTFDGQNQYPGKYGQIMLWGKGSGLTIGKNIFANSGGPAVVAYQTSGACSIASNFLTGGMTTDSACSVSGSVLNGDPQFVAPPADYHLQKGSKAAGYGAYPIPGPGIIPCSTGIVGPGGTPMTITWNSSTGSCP